MISEEIKGPGKLYSEEGAVNLGWSRHPQLDLNIEKARFMKIKAFQKFRTKRWDYYYVFAEKFFFSVTLADLGYIGTSFIYFYDYEKNTVTEDMIIIPLASGFQMVRNSDKGRTCFENKKIKVVFDVDESGRSINLEFPSFNKGEGVEAHFKLIESDGLESVCVSTPIEKAKMNYTHKICCMRAQGTIKRGSTVTELNPDRDLGGLDWSRGFLAYNTFWNWACTSFCQDGHTIGLNLCYGLNDTKDTENAFFFDGKCHKLDQVRFEFDREDRMKPWKVWSTDNRLKLDFIPDKERIARTNALFIKSEVHQMFGKYYGELILEDGTAFKVDGIRGAIEDHHARW